MGLILADEPTAHLDEDNEAMLLKLLSGFNVEYKTAIIMTTVSPDQARKFKRTYQLKRGVLTPMREKIGELT